MLYQRKLGNYIMQISFLSLNLFVYMYMYKYSRVAVLIAFQIHFTWGVLNLYIG